MWWPTDRRLSAHTDPAGWGRDRLLLPAGPFHVKAFLLVVSAAVLLASCGYHFSGAAGTSPFPPSVKTIVIKSATNSTTITGIETELTNRLRDEFALSTGLDPVRSGGDVVLNTVIAAYRETPTTYKADARELTRMGTLQVLCNLVRTSDNKVLWKKDFSASYGYLVTDSISQTLSNRRRAISRMIEDLVIRIHSSLYELF
jgi:hypothetical protein